MSKRWKTATTYAVLMLAILSAGSLPVLNGSYISSTLSGGGGGGTWGSITGTLSSQTDLQNALNLKATIASPTFTGTVTSPAWVASGLTGATAASRYVGATASGAPASGTFVVGDFCIDQTGKTFVCTTLGSPGTWTQTGSTYTLPTATNSILGGVKPDNVSILNSAGVLTATATSVGAAPAASPTFTGQAAFNTLGYSSLTATTESAGAATINWGTGGNAQKLTLVGGTCTLTMTAPTKPGPIFFEVVQPSSGGPCVITWPSNVFAAGGSSTLVLSTGASALDVLSGFYDGTQFVLGVAVPNASH